MRVMIYPHNKKVLRMFLTTKNEFYHDYNGDYCYLYHDDKKPVATINIEDNLLTISKIKSYNTSEIDLSDCDDSESAFETIMEFFDSHNYEIDEEEIWELTMRCYNEGE